MRLYAISGSLRAASVHSALLLALKAHAPDGVEIEICDLIGQIPIFNPDLEGERTPAVVETFAEKVGRADALIIACPEYAHGIPGGLKNAFDWLVSRSELVGKPFMFAHGYHNRGQYGLAALREVLLTASLIEMPMSGFNLPLVGKTPLETSRLLAHTETRPLLEAILLAVATWFEEQS
jgi:chromate reductase, NAD(P)H dehydrogenase (quinone)